MTKQEFVPIEINESTLKLANGLGLNVKKEYNTIEEVLKLIPSSYYFCGQLLWVGDNSVEMRKYSHAETVIHMAIKLKRMETGDMKIYGGVFS